MQAYSDKFQDLCHQLDMKDDDPQTTNQYVHGLKSSIHQEYMRWIGLKRIEDRTFSLDSLEKVIDVCINIDVNYITDEVLHNKERLEEFFRNYRRTEMVLEENILGKMEYEKALKGKRHWMQE